MSFSNQTEHYELPQYAPDDKPTYLGDMNGAYATIDTQIYNANTKANSASETATSAGQTASEAKQQATENKSKIQNLQSAVEGLNLTINNTKEKVTQFEGDYLIRNNSYFNVLSGVGTDKLYGTIFEDNNKKQIVLYGSYKVTITKDTDINALSENIKFNIPQLNNIIPMDTTKETLLFEHQGVIHSDFYYPNGEAMGYESKIPCSLVKDETTNFIRMRVNEGFTLRAIMSHNMWIQCNLNVTIPKNQ